MNKKHIVLFDMDGTLTPPRGEFDKILLEPLRELSNHVEIGILTGSDLDYVEVVDTRNVMDETCYYNDIEPNDKGAKRIGKQIFNWLWYNNAFKELKGI